jgi:riboflavin synthase
VFTGIVEEVGQIADVRREDGGRRLTVHCDEVLSDLRTGASVSVSGVCLTVEAVDVRQRTFRAFAVGETLRRTTLGAWRRGTSVNLERSLRASDRMGGHVVQGHVDAVGTVRRVGREGAARRVDLELPKEIRPFVAFKGSLAVDGVSLTVGACSVWGCELHLIPETLKRTTLGSRRSGDAVNLEVDLLARYLLRFVESGVIGSPGPDGLHGMTRGVRPDAAIG